MRTILIYVFLVITTCSCEEDCVRPERCNLQPQIDQCYAAIPRYYFDQKEKRCKEYIWGGCTEFPFQTLEECKQCECNNPQQGSL